MFDLHDVSGLVIKVRYVCYWTLSSLECVFYMQGVSRIISTRSTS
jgi:hypothetical protein